MFPGLLRFRGYSEPEPPTGSHFGDPLVTLAPAPIQTLQEWEVFDDLLVPFGTADIVASIHGYAPCWPESESRDRRESWRRRLADWQLRLSDPSALRDLLHELERLRDASTAAQAKKYLTPPFPRKRRIA